MKKIISLSTLLLVFIYTSYGAMVCYVAYGNHGWDCFGSNGTCGGTWSACACTGCGDNGSTSGCTTCCCVSLIALPATNCTTCIVTVTSNELHLTIGGGSPIDLGNISQLSLGTHDVFQASVDQVKRAVTFSIYDGSNLISQMEHTGSEDKSKAFLRTKVIGY